MMNRHITINILRSGNANEIGDQAQLSLRCFMKDNILVKRGGNTNERTPEHRSNRIQSN